MTSRERVLAAFDHKETDRIPVDFSGHRSSGISAVLYPKLRRFLDLPEKSVRIYDMVQQLAIVDDDVLDFFGVDTIEMGRGFLSGSKDWKEWSLSDGTPCLIPSYIQVEKRERDWILVSERGNVLGVQKPGCLYFEQTHFPFANRKVDDGNFSDLEEILDQTVWTGVVHPGAHLPLDSGGLKEMKLRAAELRESTDRAIIGLFGGNMFEIPQMLFRMDHYLMYLHEYPEQMLEFGERLCSIHLSNLEKWLNAVGPYIDIIQFGDDLGGQYGPLISPETYREFIQPFHRRLWQKAKHGAGHKVMLHCCGGIRELIPDLIDAGLDAVNPVQTNCTGMEPKKLKKDFGEDLTFWGGGCDTRQVLPMSTPQNVKDHVKRQIEVLAPSGGFVFQQIHNIQADVPPENIAAMFSAVKESSRMGSI